MEIICIILSIFIVILSYIVVNLYNKNSILSSKVEHLGEIEETVVEFVQELLVTFTKTYTQLVRVDKNGSFQTDDEVGFVFNTIKQTIEQLKDQLTFTIKEIELEDGSENI